MLVIIPSFKHTVRKREFSIPLIDLHDFWNHTAERSSPERIHQEIQLFSTNSFLKTDTKASVLELHMVQCRQAVN